jgi:hypothetical protein
MNGAGLTFGAITVVAIAFVMGATGGDAPTSVLAAMLGGIATSVVVRGVTPAPAQRRVGRPRRYGSAKELREAREKLTASRAYHLTMLHEKGALRRRLVALRDKMEAVALPAYRHRIASVDVALATIDKQMAIASQLREGYDKSITMIEIELESGDAAHHMHEDISALIAESIHELRTIEESQAELARQLEANVEVELLLRR